VVHQALARTEQNHLHVGCTDVEDLARFFVGAALDLNELHGETIAIGELIKGLAVMDQIQSKGAAQLRGLFGALDLKARARARVGRLLQAFGHVLKVARRAPAVGAPDQVASDRAHPNAKRAIVVRTKALVVLVNVDVGVLQDFEGIDRARRPAQQAHDPLIDPLAGVGVERFKDFRRCLVAKQGHQLSGQVVLEGETGVIRGVVQARTAFRKALHNGRVRNQRLGQAARQGGSALHESLPITARANSGLNRIKRT
jgi:hypothetical protein